MRIYWTIAAVIGIAAMLAQISAPANAGKTCTPVSFYTTSFGEKKTRHYTNKGLARQIKAARDQLAGSGAKKISVIGRKMSCKLFLDARPVIPVEYACTAKARVCAM